MSEILLVEIKDFLKILSQIKETGKEIDVLKISQMNALHKADNWDDFKRVFDRYNQRIKNKYAEYKQIVKTSIENIELTYEQVEHIVEIARNFYGKWMDRIRHLIESIIKFNYQHQGRDVGSKITALLKENMENVRKNYYEWKSFLNKFSEKRVIEKIIAAFNKEQAFPKEKKLINEDGSSWSEGQKISKKTLEIFEPNIKEMKLVQLEYTIDKITPQEYGHCVTVIVTIKCKETNDTFKVKMSEFLSQNDMDKKIVDNYLASLKETYSTSNSSNYTFKFKIHQEYTADEMGIKLSQPNFDATFKYIVYYNNIERGEIVIDLVITKNFYQNQKTLLLTGFRQAFNHEINNYLRSYDGGRYFDLKYKINKWNSYRDAINEIKNTMIEIGIGEDFINSLTWKTEDIDQKIAVTNSSSEFSKEIFVYINQTLIGCYNINFKNIAIINMAASQTFDFKDDNTFDLIIGGYGYGEVKKSFVLINDFHKKYRSWEFFSKNYQKIVLNNIEFSSKIGLTNFEFKNDFELLPKNEILLKNSFINSQYQMYRETEKNEHSIFQQLSRIWCELSINEKDELVITFFLSGFSISDRLFPFYLWLKVTQITIENNLSN